MKSNICLAVVVGLLLVLGGCSQDPGIPRDDQGGLVQATLDPTSGGFSLVVGSAAGPDSLARGPFLLRGENLRYDDGDGTLMFELFIRNDSGVNQIEPVSITFRDFIPEDVVVWNAPNGSTLVFGFANDDLWWTPGEESLPLTVMLLVEEGVSVGFFAQVNVGGIGAGGVIAGRAWLDDNLNGEMDPGEPGLPDLLFRLDDGGPQENLVLAQTGPDGRYVFSDLAVGLYEVSIWQAPHLAGTTSAVRHVLLVPENGGVSSFEAAHFGFIYTPGLPGPVLDVHEPILGSVRGFPGETTITHSIQPGQELNYVWEAFYLPPVDGPFITAFRYGWDLADANDPNDPNWAVAPGLTPEHMFAPSLSFADGFHRLTVQCEDDQGSLTRVHIMHAVTEVASVRRGR